MVARPFFKLGYLGPTKGRSFGIFQTMILGSSATMVNSKCVSFFGPKSTVNAYYSLMKQHRQASCFFLQSLSEFIAT